ncbi:MAG TPA: diaminopropionate ammonia-lyase [Actinomycetota bacterium]|jgi:diaminopropionate ammonia-lyase|nr:diaminopropionate ammonia-lyase [Actinomycetota bacterium]
MSTRTFVNPSAQRYTSPIPATREPLDFHRRLPGYEETRLVEAPTVAEALGVGEVWVKDESGRLGLPSFKILGASWATFQAVAERLGEAPGEWRTLGELAERLAGLRPMTLSAATDGNHGRAVARMARLLEFEARIFVPQGTARARIEAIESEGAPVTVVDGTYEDAVEAAAVLAGDRCLLIQDTAVEGQDRTARWVIEGYSTIFWEVEDRLSELGREPPDLVAVQIGVGALAASVVRYFRRPPPSPRPRIVGVEPDRAACVLASVEAGEIVTIPGPHDSAMAGLNCGTPSSVAWPEVSAGIDLFVAVEDEGAFQAMRALAEAGIVSGETGAAGLAGLREIVAGGERTAKETLAADERTRVLLVSTEGATDPDAYRRILGR